MSQVSVRRAEGGSTASQSLSESLNTISDSIRNRAFELSQADTSGNPVNDWLQAERDLYWIPQAELAETDCEYRLQVAVPGLDSKNIEVVVQANTIVVRGSSNLNAGSSGDIQYSEFSSKTLLRRFDLISSIDTSAVTAKLENGLLSITAAKTTGETKSSAAGA